MNCQVSIFQPKFPTSNFYHDHQGRRIRAVAPPKKFREKKSFNLLALYSKLPSYKTSI